MVLLLDDGLGHGSNLLANHSLPNSQLSVGQNHNAQAARKLPTANSGRSKRRLAASFAQGAGVRHWPHKLAHSLKSGHSTAVARPQRVITARSQTRPTMTPKCKNGGIWLKAFPKI
jgi:hypothetical protein